MDKNDNLAEALASPPQKLITQTAGLLIEVQAVTPASSNGDVFGLFEQNP